MNEFLYNAIFIASGIFITLQLLFGAIIIGSILGLCFAILRYKNIASFIINRFISIIRGTPMILQLSFVYFSLPLLLNIRLSIVSAGILTFGLNSSAYIAEILRAGIENIPKGQFEAAQTLQIPSFYMWKDIILPQVLRNILPAMISEIITLIKETALIATIGGMDIMRKSQIIASEHFIFFVPLCIAALYYYSLVILIEYLGKKLEKKWQYVKN
jgi:polar amino acid transport system permease protein